MDTNKGRRNRSLFLFVKIRVHSWFNRICISNRKSKIANRKSQIIMSHHFVDLLEELKSRLARMTALVQQIVEQSVESVFNADAIIAQLA